jgi:stage II sporulation protein AB (anti-sigma F factor)
MENVDSKDMMNSNYMKLEVPALSENVSFVRAIISVFATKLDLTVSELEDIKTAVSEAITNSIVHGYRNSRGSVKIFARIVKNSIEISVKDDGCGIPDIEKAMEPSFTTSNPEERGGMGFAIMKSFMDDFKVESSVGVGTVVTMKKVVARIADDVVV